jgi:hypothetical protein
VTYKLELREEASRVFQQLDKSVQRRTPASPAGPPDAAGHVNSNVTRAVYRHLIADTVTRAPAAMDHALAGGKTA